MAEPIAQRPTVALSGGTGFVGSAVRAALLERGFAVTALNVPRLSTAGRDPVELEDEARSLAEVRPMAEQLAGVDCLINAAGVSDALSRDENALFGANALLPGALAAAASLAGVARMIHISSAAVQGSLTLDETETQAPFSAYSRSKAVGERALWVAESRGTTAITVYRPTGVHDCERAVTRSVVKVARSRLSTVSRRQSGGAPQVLRANMADAVAFLVSRDATPRIVTHPNQVSPSELLQLLGGRKPLRVPSPIARMILAATKSIPKLSPVARRLEVLWFGQPNTAEWLNAAGWSAPLGHHQWSVLGATIRSESDEGAVA